MENGTTSAEIMVALISAANVPMVTFFAHSLHDNLDIM